MPIYEFYCADCHAIYQFFSRRVNTKKTPACPVCGRKKLSREVSSFAITGKAKEGGELDDLPVDEAKFAAAMESLAGEAAHINEDDPRQAADLMRKLTNATGMEMGPAMREALSRMEAGEDPESIETDLGPQLEAEDPFLMPSKAGGALKRRLAAPRKDENLFDM